VWRGGAGACVSPFLPAALTLTLSQGEREPYLGAYARREGGPYASTSLGVSSVTWCLCPSRGKGNGGLGDAAEP